MSTRSIDPGQTHVAQIIQARRQSELLMEYPFLTDIVTGSRNALLSTLFDEKDVIQPFARAFDEYEKKILQRYDSTSVQVRKLLRWKERDGYPAMPAESSPTTAVHEECFSFVAGYALLDRWAKYRKIKNILPANIVPKRLNMALLESVKMPYFGELGDVTQLLRRAREYRALVQTRPQIRAINSENDLIAHHLNQMAFHTIRAESNHILNNIRIAGFNLAFKLKGQTSTVGRLPNIPDKKTQLGEFLSASLSKEDAERVKAFLKRMKPAQLKAVLDIVDAVSPLALLLPHPLSSHHVIARENLLKLGASLGNDKDQLLVELETALYECLVDIALEAKDPELALGEFLDSQISTCFDTLDPTHPAVTFFRPIDLVPSISLVEDGQLSDENEPSAATASQKANSAANSVEAPNQTSSQEREADRGHTNDEGEDAGGGAENDQDMERRETDDEHAVEGGKPDDKSETEAGKADDACDAAEGETDDEHAVEGGKPDDKSEAEAGKADDACDAAEGETNNEHDAEGEDNEETTRKGDGGHPTTAHSGNIEEERNPHMDTTTDQSRHQPEEAVIETGSTDTGDKAQPSQNEADNGTEPEPPNDGRRKSTRLQESEKPAKDYKEFNVSTPKPRNKNSKKPKSKAIIEEDEDIKPDINYRSKYWEPIDVDLYVEDNNTTLEAEKHAERIECEEEFTFFKADRSKHTFKLSVHTPEMLGTFKELMAAVEAAYIDGLPAFLSNPTESGVFMTRHADFLQMDERVIQEHLRNKSIYITDCPSRKQDFRQAVMDVTSMQTMVDVQDLSLKPDRNKNKYLKRAKVKTIVNCIEKQVKILNALQFPLSLQGFTRSGYSSDSYALHETQSDSTWKHSFSPPAKDTNWAVVSSQYAYHGFHGDAAGLGTKVNVNGKKLWLIGRPVPGKQHIFSSINCYLNSKFDIDKGNTELFELEAIFLDETTTLIMRPGTPHAVITLENSVTIGNHFYAMASIQSTAFSIMHSFVLEKVTTNTSHPACMFLIRQLITFVHRAYIKGTLEKDDRAWNHVPDLKSVESLIDLLTLCNLGILHNVIDSETYTHYSCTQTRDLSSIEKEQWWTYDCNASTFMRRRAAIHTRGLALELIEWVDLNYKIEVPIVDGSDKINQLTFGCAELARHYLAQQCVALLRYKEKAEAKNWGGVDNCTLNMLRRQIAGIFPLRNDPMRAAIVSILEKNISQMRFPDFIQPVNNPHHPEPVEIRKMHLVKVKTSGYTPTVDLLVRGLSALDIKYLKYTAIEDISAALNTLKEYGPLIELNDEYETSERMDAYDSTEIPPMQMEPIHPRESHAGAVIGSDDDSDDSDGTYEASERSSSPGPNLSSGDDDSGAETVDEGPLTLQENDDLNVEEMLRNVELSGASETGSSTEEESGMDVDDLPLANRIVRDANIEFDQDFASDSDEDAQPVPRKRRVRAASTESSSPIPLRKRIKRRT